MKRRELIKELVEKGCVLIRHGAKHDWYQNPATKASQPVPRHIEINEVLAQRILRALSWVLVTALRRTGPRLAYEARSLPQSIALWG